MEAPPDRARLGYATLGIGTFALGCWTSAFYAAALNTNRSVAWLFPVGIGAVALTAITIACAAFAFLRGSWRTFVPAAIGLTLAVGVSVALGFALLLR